MRLSLAYLCSMEGSPTCLANTDGGACAASRGSKSAFFRVGSLQYMLEVWWDGNLGEYKLLVSLGAMWHGTLDVAEH